MHVATTLDAMALESQSASSVRALTMHVAQVLYLSHKSAVNGASHHVSRCVQP